MSENITPAMLAEEYTELLGQYPPRHCVTVLCERHRLSQKTIKNMLAFMDITEGLTDKSSSQNRGKSAIPEDIWNYFLYAYLDDRCLPITQCYELTKGWAMQFVPEMASIIPGIQAFRRRIKKDIPKAMDTIGQYDNRHYGNHCAPYITRLYDGYQQKIRRADSLSELKKIADSMTPEERAVPAKHFKASRALEKLTEKMWRAACSGRFDCVSEIALRACGLAKPIKVDSE